MSNRSGCQFGIGQLLLAAVVVNVMAAMAAGLVFHRSAAFPTYFFVAIAVAAPLAMLFVVSAVQLIRQAYRQWRRWRDDD